MTTFGILHTAISVLPIGFGLAAFVRDGRIDLRNRLGKLYLATMIAGTVSSFGFLPARGFNPAQAFTLITAAMLAFALVTLRGQWRGHSLTQTISLSVSFFFLMFFTTTETLTRVPVGRPFASGPNDPALIPVRLTLLTVLAIGIALHVRASRSANRKLQYLPA